MADAKKLPSQLIHQFVDLAHSDLNLEALTDMLEQHPGLLEAVRPGKDKETALGAATHSRAKGVIELLLGRGLTADIFVACALDQRERVVKFLDPNPKLVKARAKHAHKFDLMDLAPSGEMVHLLLERGYPMTIHLAAGKGMLDQIDRLLLEDASRLEALDREKATPLFAAIWGGQDEAALHLIQLGAETDVDGAGGRPMSYACCWGRQRVVRALLDRDVDLSYIGFHYGFTHLHACCYWGHEGMGELSKTEYEEAILLVIRWLIEGGVDATVRDKKGHTAHELALEQGFVERAALIAELS